MCVFVFRGSYSTVVKCREKTTNYEFVAKIVEVEGDAVLRGKVWQETDLLRELSHARIIHLEDSFDNKSRIFLVTE